MRLIDADALLKAMEEERQYLLARGQTGAEHIIVHHCLPIIDNAPTVEQRPQGDLISRTELKKCAIPCEIHNGALTDLCVPLYQIDNAPTVSPERPQGEWIPVNERLPEEMQRVLIWFEYYRYGDFNCMYKTYGFGYVCDGKWSPFINGETGWQDYRVIAWMPLPEPYKKGGAE